MKRILRQSPLMLLILLITAGCSCLVKKHGAESLPPVHYVYSEGLDLTWREDQSGPTFQLYGVLRSYHPGYLENLVMTVDFLNEDGKVIESHSYPDFPIIIKPGVEVPFMLKYPPPPDRRGERVVFHFHYYLPNFNAADYRLYEEFSLLSTETTTPPSK